MDNKTNPNEYEVRRTELEKLRRELMAEEALKPRYKEEEIAPEEIKLEELGESEVVVGLPEPSTEQKLMWQEVDAKATDNNVGRSYLFYLLPDAIKIRLASEKTASQIRELAAKYNLDKLKISSIATIIKDLYIAEFDLKDFIRILKERLELDNESAKNLAKEIANNILAPDKEFLKRLHASE